MTTPSRLLGLHGYAQSGKDTLASQLVAKDGFTRRGFADAMRAVLYETNPILPSGQRLRDVVDAIGFEAAKQTIPGVREYLQDIAMAVRHHVDPLAWVNVVFRDAATTNLVLSDVRVLEEVDALRAHGGVFVRIIRPGLAPVNSHVTETALDHVPADITLLNDDTPETLYERFWAAYTAL